MPLHGMRRAAAGAAGGLVGYVSTVSESGSVSSVSSDFSAVDVQSGDLILVTASGDGGIWNGMTAGYTQMYTGDAGAIVYYKTADGTETSITLSCTVNNFEAATINVSVWRGYTYTSNANTVGATGMPDPPSLASFSSGDIAVAVGHLDDDAITMTVPSGYTLVDAFDANFSALTAACSHIVCYKKSSGGTENPGVFGGGGDDQWTAATIRLSPT